MVKTGGVTLPIYRERYHKVLSRLAVSDYHLKQVIVLIQEYVDPTGPMDPRLGAAVDYLARMEQGRSKVHAN